MLLCASSPRQSTVCIVIQHSDVPFTVLGHVRVETVTITVAGFLDFEQIATVVEIMTPPALRVEYFVARTHRL